jgi:hypothetical protein
MPSQPFTATPPFFQSVLSLFSRKVFLPVEPFSAATMAMGGRRGQWMLRLTPHADAADD